MENLDIDTASTNFSAYDSCRILIEFTGGHFTERLQRTTTHTVIVPYVSLSRKLQTIQRLGSKIINVSIHHPQLEVLKVNPENAVKTKASTQISHEDNKKDSNTQVQESIAIAEPITIFEQVLELEPEIVGETISEIILATKSSSKSGHGFNKPKGDTKSPRSPKQPKS